jgi:hypothetical protein
MTVLTVEKICAQASFPNTGAAAVVPLGRVEDGSSAEGVIRSE